VSFAASQALLEDLAAAEERYQKVRLLEEQWAALEDLTGQAALDLLVAWTAAVVEAAGARGVVVGVSGGVDSSLAAFLAARGLPGRCLGLLMPISGDPEDEEEARRLLELLQMPAHRIPLQGPLRAMIEACGGEEPALGVEGNLQSRLRHAALYYEANRRGFLVLGTGDLEEAYLGYSTKGTTADLFPLTGLHKSEVRALVRRALGPLDAELAARLAGRPSSPGYRPGMRAEQELGFSFETLGAALDVILEHCDIRPMGVFPRDPAAFEMAIAARGLDWRAVVATCRRISANYHKSFASPALYRPPKA
jgi:NAD+ synthase